MVFENCASMIYEKNCIYNLYGVFPSQLPVIATAFTDTIEVCTTYQQYCNTAYGNSNGGV